MTCDQLEPLLVEYVEGDLPAEQAAAVRDHLEHCAQCRSAERQTRELLGDLSAARGFDDDTIGDVAADETPSATPERLGDFEIIEEIGRGGMGVVYRARQVTLNRIVALKVLAAGSTNATKAIARFEREAQAAARLHHTNIVPVYAQGAIEGCFYYAMELIEGPSLADLIRQWREARDVSADASDASAAGSHSVSGSRDASGRRSRRDYQRLATQFAGIADALHHAHESGVVHRDVKPHNLLLGRDGEFHVTDFGLARMLHEPGITLSSDLVGTPAYMAPEQVDPRYGAIDARTDVYALGVALYEALTLERPFVGETYEQIIRRVLDRDPLRCRKIDPRIPLDLETICLRAIEKEPARRFPSAAALARDLRRFAGDYPIESRRVGPLGRAARWCRRRPAQAAALALAMLIAILGPTAWWFAHKNAAQRVEAAWEMLLTDYHDAAGADAALGRVGRWFGEPRRLTMIDATRFVLTAPLRSIELLQPACAAGDADALYLCAWARRRMSFRDPQAWSAALELIRRGDAVSDRASAAGWFFRGMALTRRNPIEADASFERAIIQRANFTQAWLQQGRAIQQIMYLTGGIEYYEKGVARLEAVTKLDRNNAYAWYLLSNAHRLAGEELLRRGDEKRAQDVFDEALRAARAAQTADPRSSRGYAAQAAYHESRGQFREAIAAWNTLDNPQMRLNDAERSERYAYQMRLHFWLGECEAAEQMRALRYSAASGYDPAAGYDADEALFGALIARHCGDEPAARRFAQQAIRASHGQVINLLLAMATTELVGIPPTEIPEVDADAQPAGALPPEWTPRFARALLAFQRGRADEAELLTLINEQLAQLSDDARRLAAPFLFAPLHFHAGVRALAAGDRRAALDRFQMAADAHDDENYCFRAAFILGRLRADAAPTP
ncbi:MAG: hypothetical protein D6744_11995 [Planctomycetota bacterium]|nr:MAG: hypothetical protein D6744_11995 [Planctomycetota bacterium]